MNRNSRKEEKIILPCQIVSYTDLICLIDEIDFDFYSRWNTRKFIKNYPIIYKNIIYYTSNYPNDNLNDRVKRLREQDIKKFYNYTSLNYLMTINGPITGYIKNRNRNFNKKNNFTVGSLEYYVNKYGKDEGIKKYKKRYENLSLKHQKPYSKSSQKLFKLLNLRDSYYAENNKEWMIFLDENDKRILNQNVIYVDFRYKNKIIEYDCDYWHNTENDKKRDMILKEKGFEILRINHEEYMSNPKMVVKKCLNFLKPH